MLNTEFLMFLLFIYDKFYALFLWFRCVNYRVEHLRDRLGAQYYTSLLERLDSLTIVNPAVKQVRSLTLSPIHPYPF